MKSRSILTRSTLQGAQRLVRGVAGAEPVDGDQDPCVAEFGDRRPRAVSVGDQRVLGDLEFQTRRREAGLARVSRSVLAAKSDPGGFRPTR